MNELIDFLYVMELIKFCLTECLIVFVFWFCIIFIPSKIINRLQSDSKDV
jgi:hypothetical protein